MNPNIPYAEKKPSWYVLHTYPNCEKRIHDELKKRAFEVYLPLVKETRQWTDRKMHIQRPLFPNYIFVQATPVNMWDLLGINRVLRYVTYNGKPAVVKESEIDIIKKFMPENPQICKTPIKNGSLVKIIEGPFAGMQGLVVMVKNSARFCIRLDILNQYISIELPGDLIEKIG